MGVGTVVSRKKSAPGKDFNVAYIIRIHTRLTLSYSIRTGTLVLRRGDELRCSTAECDKSNSGDDDDDDNTSKYLCNYYYARLFDVQTNSYRWVKRMTIFTKKNKTTKPILRDYYYSVHGSLTTLRTSHVCPLHAPTIIAAMREQHTKRLFETI